MPGNTATIILEAKSTGIKRGTDSLKKLAQQAKRSEKATNQLRDKYGRFAKSVEKDSKRAQRASGHLTKSFARMGKVAGIAAVAIGAVFVRQVIKNTIEQEHAVAQLNASLKSTGRFSEEASEAMRDYAASLQQASTFGDEAIITMQSQLLTFKQLGGDVLPRTTQAVLDLATKMGQDLTSSAVQLGKALNDPVANLGALGRVGIQFSKDQKELIKSLAETGRLAEAQAIILTELESEFGGAAKAARDTLGGALKAVSLNFGDLLEVSGDGTTGVTGSLNELADILADPEVKQGFQDIATAALSIVGAFAQATSSIVGFTSFIADEIAATIGGVALDDIIRMEDEIESLNRTIEGVGLGFISADLPALEKRRQLLIDAIKLQTELAESAAIRGRGIDDAAGRVAGAIGAIGGDDEPTGPSESDLKKAADARNRLLQESARASDDLRQSLRDLAAETGGPVVEANQRLEDTLAGILEQENALLATGSLTEQQFQDLETLREGANEQHRRTIELLAEEAAAKEALLTPTEQLISDLEFENNLLGMTNLQRQTAIALRGLEADATDVQKGRVTELIAEQNRLIEQQMIMEQLSGVIADSATGFFTEFINGTLSAKEAFEGFAKSVLAEIARIIIQKAILASVDGGGGGNVGGIIASLFGGGRAHGGPVSAGVPYLVGERGPELIVPNNAGTVVPNNQLSNVTPISKNQITNITVNLPPSVRRITAQQTATEVSRIQKRASSRNR